MGVEGERKRLEMAGATGAIEEGYRQGLTSHANRLNKVRLFLLLHRSGPHHMAPLQGGPRPCPSPPCKHPPHVRVAECGWARWWLDDYSEEIR